MKRDLYVELGIPRDAPPAAVKRAWKRRASKTHPDNGGKTDEFQAVQHAYAILANPEARERYDRTGSDSQRPEQDVIADIVAALFDRAVAALEDIDHFDPVLAARDMLAQATRQTRESIARLTATQHKWEAIERRLRRRHKAGHDVLVELARKHVAQCRLEIAKGELELEQGTKAGRILADYSYTTEEAPPWQGNATPSSGSSWRR